MKVATITISFPVLQIRSRAVYAALRKPTVFELGILEAINDYAADPVYGEYSLLKVFGEMLGVPETDRLLLPSLRQLAELGLVKTGTNLDELEKVALRTLALTTQGREILARKVFPGVQMTRDFSHSYDPVRDRLLLGEELEQLSESPAEQFIEWDDEEAVAVSLAEDAVRSGAESQVSEVKTRSLETKWLNRSGDLLVSPEGELTLSFGDNLYDDYFRHFSSRWLIKNVLASLLTDWEGAAEISSARPRVFGKLHGHLSDVFPAGDLDLKLKLSGEMVTHFLNYQPYLKPQLKCRSQTLLVVFGNPAKERQSDILWDENINGAVIFVDRLFPLQNGYYLSSTGENLFIDLFELTVNGDPYPIPLGYSLKSDDKRLATAALFKLLEPLIDKTGDVQQQLIKLFWQPPDQVWARIKEMTS